MAVGTTHAYAVLEISASAYAEIRDKLKAAGYEDTFHKDPREDWEGAPPLIDMHGIALRCEKGTLL